MTELLIIGAGGHGKVVADTAEACGYSDIGFLDQSWPEHTKNGRWKIIGKPTPSDVTMFCAVGKNDIRAHIFEEYHLNNSPVLIHPSAILSPTVKMGPGALAVAGSIVNADTSIGRGAILNTACSVDHDCLIGDFVHISPGAHLAGDVRVGDGTWIGIGAVVREGVRIGKNVIVAAGAAVISDIEDRARVGGVPARKF
jgi:sugar O-acyltransferase (sialic acid O-acetyltransferase NeuD family)